MQEDEAGCTESFPLSVVIGLLCVVLGILLSSFGDQLWRAFCNTMQNRAWKPQVCFYLWPRHDRICTSDSNSGESLEELGRG